MKTESISISKSVCVAFFLLSGSIFIVSPAQAETNNPHFPNLTIPALVEVLNADRQKAGLHPLRRDTDLDLAASLKAQHMIDLGYFAHTSPDDITPWYWFQNAGYHYLYAGENLGLGFSDAQSVQQAWMESPEHRQNILSADYEDVGYGIAYGNFTNINGKQQNRQAIIIVQLFGQRTLPANQNLTTENLNTINNPAHYNPSPSQSFSLLGVNKIWENVDSPINISKQNGNKPEPENENQAEPIDWALVSLALLAVIGSTTGFQNRII